MPKDPNSPRQEFPPDPVVAAEICARLSKGETLLKILDKADRPANYPCRMTFYEWLRNDGHIAEMYDRARAAGLEVLAEGCIEIAESDVDMVEGKRDPGHIAHKKLQIDTRLRLLSKWSPKKYGDKLEFSGNADQPVVVENKMPITELMEAIFAAQEAAAKQAATDKGDK